ncbi:hypothetical protein AALO_G00026040 [Alosa alosa]|uniref:Uncharacterized protein n=1 Tax=Alosa alosa TaxID=278164 RepID=A0AAV6HAH4_9TELE|nr:uncharacterized protein LOC125291198 [Alosa alosa]KAG5284378.1 hypothetical protein AALO_G00026040 [Alosa alosa]
MEERGEHGCFMEAIRVCLATIRDRIRQRRTRQRTKNDRISRNSAMEKGRKGKKSPVLNSGMNTKVYKPKHAAKVTPANMDTAQGRRQEEDGAPGKLQDRMKASLQAFQEQRKPYWVFQREWREKTLDQTNRVDSKAREDLQPGEPASENANIEDTEAGEDLQPDEQASWVVANGEMWQKMAQDGPVVCNIPIMNSDQGSSYPVPAERSLDTQAGEDVQPDEPANWVVANAQMWQKMAQDGPVIYTMPFMNFEGLLVTQAGEELQADEQDFYPDEPASWVVANGQICGRTWPNKMVLLSEKCPSCTRILEEGPSKSI